jgi:hypothetical protein
MDIFFDLFGKIIVTVCAVLLAIAIVYMILVIRKMRKKNDHDMSELTCYRATYLSILRNDLNYGPYELRSFDGGRNWYVIECPRSEVIIRGTIDAVYPELRKRFPELDALVMYVKIKGPITLTGERAEEDLKILKEASVWLWKE